MLALQRTAGNRSVALALQGVHPAPAVPVVQRQPKPSEALEDVTGVDVEPDSAVNDLVGQQTPLPARFSATKRPGSGQGPFLTAPSLTLEVDPERVVGGILDTVPVKGLYLTKPTLVFNRKTEQLAAAGTVSIPTKYPAQFDSPTDIDVRITSTKADAAVQAQYGPFVADFTLKVSYDTAALKRVMAAARAGNFAGVTQDLHNLPKGSAEFSGSAGIGGKGGKVPLNYMAGSVASDDEGARVRGGAAGVIGLPAGTFHPELAVPAVGAMAGSYSKKITGAETGGFGFAGVTGKPDIAAVSSMDFGRMLEPFAYAEIKGVHKTADGHEYSIRLFGHYRLGAAPAEETALGSTRAGVDADRQRLRLGADDPYDKKESVVDPAVRSGWTGMAGGKPEAAYGAGIEIKITFDAFGSK